MITGNSKSLNIKWVIYTLKILLVIIAANLFIKRIWVGEDAFIFFRYVDNFVNGHGLVFNLSERVEGFTAPLWVFLLSALRAIFTMELRPLSIALGLVLSTISIALILIYDNSNKVFFPIGVILLITNSAFRDFATSGFETSLTYILLTILALMVKKNLFIEKPFAIGTVAALLPLNRPESALFIAYIFFVILIQGYLLHKVEKFSLQSLIKKITYFILPILILVGGYQIFRMGYFASMFPNTYYAKKGGEFYMTQGVNYLNDFIASYWLSSIIIVITTIIMFRSLLQLSWKSLIFNGPLHVFIMGMLPLLYVLYSGGDYMHGRSLLISFLCICISINTILENSVLRTVRLRDTGLYIPLFYTIVATILITLVSLPQMPITSTAGMQINGIKDERFHFGFRYEEGEFLKYFNQPITSEFDWAARGKYYKEISDAVGMPISVAMGNIGFFGYTAGENVNVMSCSLTDVYLSRFPIEKRGTVGHEGEAHDDYIFSRRPTFAYTPYPNWNKALQFKYDKAKTSSVITGDHNGSLIPVFDLSNDEFIKRYSALVGQDIRQSIDTEIVNYINEISKIGVIENFEQTTEFFGFLKIYWVPYTSKSNQDLFANTRDNLFGENVISSYESFDLKLKSESEEFLHRTTIALDRETFVGNIKFALNNFTKETNRVTEIISISEESDILDQNIQLENIEHNKSSSLFFISPEKQTGKIAIKVDKNKHTRENYVMKLSYKIKGTENSMSVNCSLCKESQQIIFEHNIKKHSEQLDVVTMYINVTDEVKETGLIEIMLNRAENSFISDIGVASIEIY